MGDGVGGSKNDYEKFEETVQSNDECKKCQLQGQISLEGLRDILTENMMHVTYMLLALYVYV